MSKPFTVVLLICVALSSYGQESRIKFFPKRVEFPKRIPEKSKVWIFFMAGQSNMAGRGLVEPQDTLPHTRILTINRDNKLIIAKEPLHFYEPNLTGLDCGLSFAKELIDHDHSITVLMIPTAVGGSSTHQWLGDSLHRNVQLLTNFKARVAAVREYGTIKGILWHQGEADTSPELITGYDQRLEKIFTQLRLACDDATLPILVGELGSFSDNQLNWDLINKSLHIYASTDARVRVVDTHDLRSKEDKIHFNSEGQRLMGARMAKMYLEMIRK